MGKQTLRAVRTWRLSMFYLEVKRQKQVPAAARPSASFTDASEAVRKH